MAMSVPLNSRMDDKLKEYVGGREVLAVAHSDRLPDGSTGDTWIILLRASLVIGEKRMARPVKIEEQPIDAVWNCRLDQDGIADALMFDRRDGSRFSLRLGIADREHFEKLTELFQQAQKEGIEQAERLLAEEAEVSAPLEAPPDREAAQPAVAPSPDIVGKPVRTPLLAGVHADPPRWLLVVLAALPFIVVIAAYLWGSHVRVQANPNEKITPEVSKMKDAIKRMAFEKDKRKGQYLMWEDTIASLKRLGIGVGLAALVGLLLGLNMGLFPGLRSLLLPFTTFVSIIPPLAILPILFITLDVEELGKISLIFIGTFLLITRDMYLTTSSIHREQITKALTLGASQFQLVFRIVLPQIMPRLIHTIRLCLGAAWLFLIAAEAVASTEGLGYRIFLVRRYMNMAVIIPYVIWITFLGFLMDLGLRMAIRWLYPWYEASKK